jgi:hypothetical protein
MPIKLTCPTCSARVSAPDQAAGKTLNCPKCGEVIRVPGGEVAAGKPPEQTVPHRSIKRMPEASRATRWPLIVAGGVLALLVMTASVAGVFYFVGKHSADPGTGGPPTTAPVSVAGGSANADYFNALAVAYEEQAVLECAQIWLEESEKYAGFHGDEVEARVAASKARETAYLMCNAEYEALDSQLLAMKKTFTQRHRLDYKDYTDTFKKDCPERDLVFQEISQSTRLLVRRRLLDLSAKASDYRVRQLKNNAPDEDFYNFRLQLVRDSVPTMLNEVRQEVRKLASIRVMAAKMK